MTTYWNEHPPAGPPTTDEDLCASWGLPSVEGTSVDAAHTHTHDQESAASQSPSYNWYGYDAPTPPPPSPQLSPPPTRGGGARVAIAGLVMILAVGLLGAGWITRGALESTGSVTASDVASRGAAPAPTTPSNPTPLVTGNTDEPVAAVAKALGPSVVLIKTDSGLGSGVVYDSKGLILTNAHVVGAVKTVTVHLGDGQTRNGTVLGADTSTDIAVVQVDPGQDIVAARLATTTPAVGQLAVALGSPFGLDQTVTAGVVSAINRPVDNGSGGVSSMIQTDAPINPGNSGGALANRRAEVIGINSMIFSQKGENNGIGFAIPIDRAKQVADTIVNGGSLDRAYLGVSSQPTADGQPGAVIAKIESGSAADTAGIKTGDVVISIDGSPIKQASDLAAAISTKSPGDRLKIEVKRGGTTTTVEVTLGAKPTADATTPNTPAAPSSPNSPSTPQPSTPRQRTPAR